MATLINNARIQEQVYEFGVRLSDGTDSRPMDYDTAMSIARRDGYQLRMRCVYNTEWMDAK